MATRPKRPRDVNQLAKLIVGIATGEVTEKPESVKAKSGRAGGLKGGVTRMSQLSNEDRAKLAKKASHNQVCALAGTVRNFFQST